MKKNLLFLLVAFCFVTRSVATTWVVLAGNFAFLPATMTIHLGDTVKWQWVMGDHTTTSHSVPTGAVSWDAPLNTSVTVFVYVPAVTGVYNYHCAMHASTMQGDFTVLPPDAVKEVNAVSNMITIYPNPAVGTMHIAVSDPLLPLTIMLTDITGREVIRSSYAGQKDVSLEPGDLPPGIYCLEAVQGSRRARQKVVVSR